MSNGPFCVYQNVSPESRFRPNDRFSPAVETIDNKNSKLFYKIRYGIVMRYSSAEQKALIMEIMVSQTFDGLEAGCDKDLKQI